MSNVTATCPSDVVRVINGMTITRYSRNGVTIWRSVERRPPVEIKAYDKRAGETVTTVYQDERILWQGSLDLNADRGRFAHIRLIEFDARPPSPLHDQLERAKAAGFSELAEAFELAAKVKARDSIRGRFPLGKVSRSLGTARAQIGDEELRGFLRRHINGDFGVHGKLADVALSDDQRWVPPLYSQAVQNAVAIESGSGVIKSRFMLQGDPLPTQQWGVHVVDLGNRRRSEDVDVTTFLDVDRGTTETIVSAPRFDL
jgi:hypothetical protein